ncbi:DUF6390 family protein [Nocardia gamkensis]|uniref:Uncharacterized protein n=1 Tax=Nocardia gamkensis TaxID=352869 RepID=A0A7X6R2Q8_9NOCA|nr:DUF6390 family protein [Nocardia gamkensis]NKY26649.1 hypothetical protein [Nocardia gamkensis]NQE71368.1 hypothetical protein [Nocardia gamkensis]
MTGGGAEMFARYAYAPNRLGYCGPPDAVALRDGSEEQVRAVARRFTGAWPYLRVMARMTGIADPLDRRLVESYWLGGGVGASLDPREFTAELLSLLGPVAGGYWTHLTPRLAEEAAANHCFHVFGVYPWSRLLRHGNAHPLHILDSCRITWGTVLDRSGGEVSLRCRRLRWDGERLTLSAETSESVPIRVDGYAALPDVAAGERVAVHWGRLCGRLDDAGVRALESGTVRQLEVTNRRLAARRSPAS